MLPLIALLTAFAAVVISLWMANLVIGQAARLRRTEIELRDLKALMAEPMPVPAIPAPSPLEGLRIGIFIRQDHDRPTLAELLKERLIQEDAHPVLLSEAEALAPFATGLVSVDIALTGDVVCNGYGDVYFEADLKCSTASGLILAIAERPAEGGRQLSLANDVVVKLKRELTRAIERSERQQALREIKGL